MEALKGWAPSSMAPRPKFPGPPSQGARAEGSAEESDATVSTAAAGFAGKPIQVFAAGTKSSSLLPVNTPQELYNLSDKELLGVFKAGVADIPSQLPGNNGALTICSLLWCLVQFSPYHTKP